MELWQMDVVGGVLLTDGRDCKIITGIDGHARFVVCAGVMARATSRAVCAHFASAMRRHGVPQEVLTDNGKVFTGRFGIKDVEVLFDRICRENGIDHLLTAPRRPTTTGKIERFHRTLRQEFLLGRLFTDLPTAQAELTGGCRATTPSGPTRLCRWPPRPAGSSGPTQDRRRTPRPFPRNVPGMGGSPAASPPTGSCRWPGNRSAAANTVLDAGSTSTSRTRPFRSGTATNSSRRRSEQTERRSGRRMPHGLTNVP